MRVIFFNIFKISLATHVANQGTLGDIFFVGYPAWVEVARRGSLPWQLAGDRRVVGSNPDDPPGNP